MTIGTTMATIRVVLLPSSVVVVVVVPGSTTVVCVTARSGRLRLVK